MQSQDLESVETFATAEEFLDAYDAAASASGGFKRDIDFNNIEAGSVQCPSCLSAKGKSCVTLSGGRVCTHADRVRVALSIAREQAQSN